MLKNHPGYVLLALLFGVTAYRVWVVATSGLNLYVDEAQYWYWAQHLAWGYYSKPPVIAAIIAGTTSVCGDSEFCIRSGSLLFYPLSTVLLFLLAKHLFDVKTALVAAVLFLTLPAVSLSSTLISTDVALFFCWTLALYAFVKAWDGNAWRDWLLLGVALGVGMLSKYTMGIFLISALLLIILEKRWEQLRNPRAWIAIALAAVIFAPNLWWNWQNGFPTFHHTADIAASSKAGFLHWDELGAFLGGQFGMFGVLLFPLLVWVVFKGEVAHKRLLLCFAFPFLLIISLQAWLGRANANWAAPVYVAATLLVAEWLVHRRAWLLSALLLNVLLGLLLYHPEPINHWLHTDLQKRLKGWDALGNQYLAIQRRYPNALLLSDDRAPLSMLAYYAHPAGMRGVSWNPRHVVRHHYDLVTTLNDKKGADFLLVTEDKLSPKLTRYFDNVQRVGSLRKIITPNYGMNFDVYLLSNFKGLKQ
jgi:4-amino-4-deoxy-L-arabinose transferase-like glycosyltransferase